MRQVILSMMVSLDGAIARANGDLDWHATDADFELEMLDLFTRIDTMLFGRVSYELLAEYWPTAGTDPAQSAPGGFTSRTREQQFAHAMNTVPKIVYSRTLTATPSWGPVRVVKDDIAGDIARMKQQPGGKDIVLFAGANIATAFIEQDLIDEYRVMVHPLIIGGGMPLFAKISQERTLNLQRTRTFGSGVVLLQYGRQRG